MLIGHDNAGADWKQKRAVAVNMRNDSCRADDQNACIARVEWSRVWISVVDCSRVQLSTVRKCNSATIQQYSTLQYHKEFRNISHRHQVHSAEPNLTGCSPPIAPLLKPVYENTVSRTSSLIATHPSEAATARFFNHLAIPIHMPKICNYMYTFTSEHDFFPPHR